MNVLFRATYPSSELYKAIDTFISKEAPKRAEYVKELATFTHNTASGFETIFILEVPDERLADYVKAQAERNAYMQTRIPNYNCEVHIGANVYEAIQTVASQRPR